MAPALSPVLSLALRQVLSLVPALCLVPALRQVLALIGTLQATVQCLMNGSNFLIEWLICEWSTRQQQLEERQRKSGPRARSRKSHQTLLFRQQSSLTRWTRMCQATDLSLYRSWSIDSRSTVHSRALAWKTSRPAILSKRLAHITHRWSTPGQPSSKIRHIQNCNACHGLVFQSHAQ